VAGKKGIASLRSHGARVRQAAAEALEAIRIRHETRVASSEALPTADDLSTAVPLREEEEIDRLLREKQPAEAAALLLERVIAYAGAGEFDAAERLRERLEAMRPLAVAERVRADEAIAAARAESGAQLDLRHFDAFCETLSPQEASAFIEALQPLSLAADESAVRQGEIGLRLLLVLSGELKVTCLAQDRESLIQVLGPGEIAGWEGCGAASVATAGIAAITRAEVAVLTCEVLEQWERSLPDLRRKLVAFCERFESVSHALASKGLDRRRYRRYPALIDTQAQLLGDDQRPTGKPFSAQLTDISAGGASLQFRVIEPRMGRLLLGRWLQLQFDLPGLGRVAAEGRVVAARPLAEGKLQLHVMFRQPLPLNDSQDT
jgi:CRP-like cAMP-binding protein